jgi:hypothetical protein
MEPARITLKCSALVAAGLIPIHGLAQVVWDESIDGDLSGDRFAPTALTLNLGDNNLLATSTGGDREYITFSVPAGQLLSSVFLDSYNDGDPVAFIGLQTGSTFTEDPASANPANLLGYTHFGQPNVGTDLLPLIGTGLGAQGFTPPLQADTYTVWLQQLGLPTNYELNFVIAPVPEPATTAACVGGLLLAGCLLRRLRSRHAV